MVTRIIKLVTRLIVSKKTGIEGFLVLFLYLTPQAQTINIKGSVLDEKNMPLSGANITLNENEYNTSTNLKGEFIFQQIPKKEYKLEASFVGYETFDTIVGDRFTDTLKIHLYPELQELDEVQVNGSQKQKIKRMESISIDLIQEEFLKENKAGSLIQTLQKIPGLNSMDIGSGLSKPMIRGMSYYRVVVAQNGIKHEGQQWSNHHGISVDQQAVSHIEVIKGPASLRYGTDAIGGVINILPAHVPISQGISGEISLTGKSNTNWLGISGNITGRRGNFYIHATITHNNYGDFRIAKTDSFLLPAPVSAAEASHKVKLGEFAYNTAGRENAFSITTGIVKPWGNSYFEFSYYSNKTGFFDWEGCRYDSQREAHASNTRDILLPYQQIGNFSMNHFTNRFFNKNKLEIAIGWQQNKSAEYGYLTDITGNRAADKKKYSDKGNLDLWLQLHTFTANVVYSVTSSNKQSFKFGVNTQYQYHSTDGYNHILPSYNRFTAGAFITHKYSLSERWVVNSGARIDYYRFEMKESLNPDPAYGDSVFNLYFRKNYPGFALSAGINFLPDDNTVVKLNIGKSYRVPSAYELGAYGLHRHEGRFEKGDTRNNPEQAWQLDIAFERKWKNMEIMVSPFLNYFTNYLYLHPTPELRREGQVYEYRQTKAMLTGGESSLDYTFLDFINIHMGAEYVYAVNLDLKMAIPFTPPLSAITEVNFLFQNKLKQTKGRVGCDVTRVWSQKYTVPNELTTPGYYSFGIHAGCEINLWKQKLNAMLKIQNLLNTKYFNHVSFYRRLRIPEPGRDVQLFISIPIK